MQTIDDQTLTEISLELRELARQAQGLPATPHIPAKKLLEYAEAIEANVKSKSPQSR
jgi:hypothetical protein